MDSDLAVAGRDVWYLAFAFCGASAASLWFALRRDGTRRARSRFFSLCFALLSAAVAAAAAGIILSNGAVLRERSFYLPAAVAAVLGLLVTRFPRTVAFPVFILSGALLSVGAFLFLRLPPLPLRAPPSAIMVRGGDGIVSVRFETRGDGASADPFVALDPSDPEAPVEVLFLTVGFDRAYPVLGGRRRGGVVAVSQGGFVRRPKTSEPLDRIVSARNDAAVWSVAGISVHRYAESFASGGFPIGGMRKVLFDAGVLRLSP